MAEAGLYGFGASAHIVCQVAVAQGRRAFGYAGGRRRDAGVRASLGAAWAGDALAGPPEELDAVILFAPVGELVPAALRHVRKGGSVVCAGIHMSDVPSFPYELLWGERAIRSVANLTRADGEEFLALAPTIPVRTEVETFPLDEANEALDRELRVACSFPSEDQQQFASRLVHVAKNGPSRRDRLADVIDLEVVCADPGLLA